MNVYFYFFILVISIKLIYGQLSGEETAIDGECLPVNILLGYDRNYNCCLDHPHVACENGHITEM